MLLRFPYTYCLSSGPYSINCQIEISYLPINNKSIVAARKLFYRNKAAWSAYWVYNISINMGISPQPSGEDAIYQPKL